MKIQTYIEEHTIQFQNSANIKNTNMQTIQKDQRNVVKSCELCSV